MTGVLVGALIAASNTPAREFAPPVGQPRPFALPARHEFRLANGLTVTLVPFGAVPKATILIDVRTGNVADGDKNGLADIVASLMKEGAGSRDAAALADAAADMGGALELGAGADQLSLTMDVLAERAGDAIALAADVLRRPQLPEQQLPRLKADLARQTAIARSQPQAIAGEAFAHLVWDDSVYGRTLPTDAQIAAIGIDDVRRFVAAELGATRTHVYVAGKIDRAAIEAAVRRAFGDWAAGPPPRQGAPQPPHARR